MATPANYKYDGWKLDKQLGVFSFAYSRKQNGVQLRKIICRKRQRDLNPILLDGASLLGWVSRDEGSSPIM